MRQFYLLIEKGVAMPHQLSWNHYRKLIPLINLISFIICFIYLTYYYIIIILEVFYGKTSNILW